MDYYRKCIFGLLCLAVLCTPLTAAAVLWTPGQPLVPCKNNCGFEDLVQLAQNLITFLLWLSVPVFLILAAYAGFLWMTAQDNAKQISKAIGILRDAVIGVFIMGCAWLLVYTSLNTLLSDAYKNRLRPLPAVQVPF